MRQCSIFRGNCPMPARLLLPAPLEACGEALVGGAVRSLADRAGYIDAAEQLLFGADLAQPSVVAGGERRAGAEAGAGIGNAQLRRLIGFVVARRVRDDAGHRHDALLDDAVTVLQRDRISLVEGDGLA